MIFVGHGDTEKVQYTEARLQSGEAELPRWDLSVATAGSRDDLAGGKRKRKWENHQKNTAVTTGATQWDPQEGVRMVQNIHKWW